jgi:hypothetical protein
MNVLRTRAVVLIAVLLALSAVACGSSDDDGGDEASSGDESTPTTEDTPDTTLPTTEKLRNERYCDVIVTIEGEDAPEVYSTFGLNKCQQAKWDELDEETVVDELEAESAILDGPRHWVFYQIESGAEPTSDDTVELGELEFARRPLLAADAAAASADPYESVAAPRDADLGFRKGGKVFTLTAPTGETYLMVSFSQQADADLKRSNLAELGDKLDLPDGWAFAAADLAESYTLAVDEEATALRDDLGNAYQLVTTPPVTGSGASDSTATTVANTATTVATTAAP